jgi:4-hydroxybenzoate polyprenyltransferase
MKDFWKHFDRQLEVLRFESWKGWLFIFGLGSVLFALPNIFPFIWLSLGFALLTAAIFVLNQFFDRENDKMDGSKSHLPIAAGEMSCRKTIMLFIFLTITSLIVVYSINISLLPLFITLAIGGVLWSAPPIRFKERPIVDVIAAGFGSGVFPLIIGLQVSHQLTLEFYLPGYGDVIKMPSWRRAPLGRFMPIKSHSPTAAMDRKQKDP